MKIKSPKTLLNQARVAIVSPAGAVTATDLSATIKLIESHHFVPVLGENHLQSFNNGYNYAGTTAQRLADLQWAFDDPNIDAIWTTRGGYGCAQLLPFLDFKHIKKNPKWYIGYSDNTAIQASLLKHGLPSIHGQCIKTASFGASKAAYENVFQILKNEFPIYEFPADKHNHKGRCKGRLVGGNLAIIYSLMGSKYNFDFKNKILFIEDIGEQYYALDRMLTNLELAGVFKQIKGLVVGGMSQMGSEDSNPDFAQDFDPLAYQIIFNKLKKYQFPKAFGFSNGHIKNNLPLIIGQKINLLVDDVARIEFLDN
jgi:muramoyltetrapeptide carboxypeptidase